MDRGILEDGGATEDRGWCARLPAVRSAASTSDRLILVGTGGTATISGAKRGGG